MKQDPNPRHRRITLRILEFAYGPGLTPEARECLAREFFRNFVLFAWETMELLLGLLGDSSGGRPAPPRWRPDGRHLMVIFPAPLPLEKTGEAQPNNKRHLEIQSRAIEAWVRAEPAQWLWLHRRWKNQFFCGKSYAAITTGPHLKRMGYLR